MNPRSRSSPRDGAFLLELEDTVVEFDRGRVERDSSPLRRTFVADASLFTSPDLPMIRFHILLAPCADWLAELDTVSSCLAS